MIELRHLSDVERALLEGNSDIVGTPSEVLMVLRHILRVPEGQSIITQAKILMEGAE